MHIVKRGGRGVDQVRKILQQHATPSNQTGVGSETVAINISTGQLQRFAPFSREEKLLAKKIVYQKLVLALPRCAQFRSYTFLTTVHNGNDVRRVQDEILAQVDQVTSFCTKKILIKYHTYPTLWHGVTGLLVNNKFKSHS